MELAQTVQSIKDMDQEELAKALPRQREEAVEAFSFSGVDLLLLDPVAQSLDADAEFGGYPGDGVLFIRNPNQPDRLAAKLRRVGWSRSGHLLSFRQTSGTQSPSVHPTVASPVVTLAES